MENNNGNNGKHLGWYKRADHPKNPGDQDPLDNIGTYEIINYVNDVSLSNTQVLMTSDMDVFKDRQGENFTADLYIWTASHEFGHILGLSDDYKTNKWKKFTDFHGVEKSDMIKIQ